MAFYKRDDKPTLTLKKHGAFAIYKLLNTMYFIIYKLPKSYKFLSFNKVLMLVHDDSFILHGQDHRSFSYSDSVQKYVKSLFIKSYGDINEEIDLVVLRLRIIKMKEEIKNRGHFDESDGHYGAHLSNALKSFDDSKKMDKDIIIENKKFNKKRIKIKKTRTQYITNRLLSSLTATIADDFKMASDGIKDEGYNSDDVGNIMSRNYEYDEDGLEDDAKEYVMKFYSKRPSKDTKELVRKEIENSNTSYTNGF